MRAHRICPRPRIIYNSNGTGQVHERELLFAEICRPWQSTRRQAALARSGERRAPGDEHDARPHGLVRADAAVDLREDTRCSGAHQPGAA